ncbi:MAG: hypothetical protein JOS17DRAFT_739463 [Linnemannia elongata]|nr:MAG: hypothetical protein JOS17DRAFT_739463 [Linnemannia elongata]
MMETAIEMLSSSTTTSGDDRRFSSSSTSSNTYSIMMTQQPTPRTITITTTTTTTTTTTAIAPTIPASSYDLRLAHQKAGTDSDVADEEDEEEMCRLEFLGDAEDDVEDDDGVQISTQSSLPSIQSLLDCSLSSPETGDHAVGVPVDFQSDEGTESESVEENDGRGEWCLGERLERFVPSQRRIDDDDEQEGRGGGGETIRGLAPAIEVVDMRKKDPAAQQDCIFDYLDPGASNSNDEQFDHGDIIAPHAPFLSILSSTTLRPQRICRVPVVSEYIDPYCPPTPPLLLPPTPPPSSAASASTSSENPCTAIAVPMSVNLMVTHDHSLRQEEVDGEESLDTTDGIAQEMSPLHPLDSHPSFPPQQQQQQQPCNLKDENPSVPPSSSTPQQQQPDRIRWRESTNYPPTRRRGERRAVTASGILATSTSGATNSTYGDTTDSTSLRSSMIAPTTFVMIDTDENQILTDPYISSVTPSLPSPLSAAIMGGGGWSSGGGGKALPAPAPLWLTTAIPRYHFTGNNNNSSNNGDSSSSCSSNSVISPTADPQVAAHVAEALRMYGIPSLHQPTTVHPFQRFSMTPSTPNRSTSLGTSTTGSGGCEPPRGSTFPRLMHRSPSRGSSSTNSTNPSRVVRVWAALTGRGVSSITTNTTNGSSRATTMVASPSTTDSRFSQLVQPSSSSSSSSATLQYEQLPFVQQPRRPTIVLPSPLTRVSVVLGSGSTTGSSIAAASSSVNGSGGNCDGSGNDGDGNDDGGDEVEEEGNDDGAGDQQQQQQTRSMVQNADPEDKDQAAAGEPSAFQTFLKFFLCGC